MHSKSCIDVSALSYSRAASHPDRVVILRSSDKFYVGMRAGKTPAVWFCETARKYHWSADDAPSSSYDRCHSMPDRAGNHEPPGGHIIPVSVAASTRLRRLVFFTLLSIRASKPPLAMADW